MHKLVRVFFVALALSIFSPSFVQALPATTSWLNSGLQNVDLVTGNISVSADACGDRIDGICDIAVEKPSGATVRSAYLVLASGFNHTAVPTRVTLSGTTVTFTHKAQETRNPTFNFTNHLADVTSIVKPVVDVAASGLTQIAVDYHLDFGSGSNFSGAALTVIFDDPAAPNATVMYNFGTTSSAGECFTLNFPSVVKSNVGTATLSVGIGWSAPDNFQVTEIKASANGRTPVVLADKAGSNDDGNNITVGGVGDNSANPTLGNQSFDDEFYRVDQLLNDGDTYLSLCTKNTSNDDNLFQSIFYLPGIAVSGSTMTTGGISSVPVQATPTPTPSASSSVTASPNPTTSAVVVQASTSKLAKTGSDSRILGIIAGLLVVFGAIFTYRSFRTE